MPLQAYLKGVGGTPCYCVEFGHIHVSIDFLERKESCGTEWNGIEIPFHRLVFYDREEHIFASIV